KLAQSVQRTWLARWGRLDRRPFADGRTRAAAGAAVGQDGRALGVFGQGATLLLGRRTARLRGGGGRAVDRRDYGLVRQRGRVRVQVAVRKEGRLGRAPGRFERHELARRLVRRRTGQAVA